MEAPNDREPWSYERLRRKLTTLIEVLPMAVAGDEPTRALLKNVQNDLVDLRAGLTKWYGAGIFTEKKKEIADDN
jgi:hypothetical protein